MPGKVGGFPLLAGDIVRMQSAGGGGYGDPLKRDPERVRRDVAMAYLTETQAKHRYGVVFQTDGRVDHTASATTRGELQAGRVTMALQLANEDDIDGPRRRFNA